MSKPNSPSNCKTKKKSSKKDDASERKKSSKKDDVSDSSQRCDCCDFKTVQQAIEEVTQRMRVIRRLGDDVSHALESRINELSKDYMSERLSCPHKLDHVNRAVINFRFDCLKGFLQKLLSQIHGSSASYDLLNWLDKLQESEKSHISESQASQIKELDKKILKLESMTNAQLHANESYHNTLEEQKVELTNLTKEIERVARENREAEAGPAAVVQESSMGEIKAQVDLITTQMSSFQEVGKKQTKLEERISTLECHSVAVANELKESQRALDRVGMEMTVFEQELDSKARQTQISQDRLRAEIGLVEYDKAVLADAVKEVQFDQKEFWNNLQQTKDESKACTTLLTRRVNNLEVLRDAINDILDRSNCFSEVYAECKGATRNVASLSAALSDAEDRIEGLKRQVLRHSVGFCASLPVEQYLEHEKIVKDLFLMTSHFGNCFDPMGGQFTAPCDGRYIFNIKYEQAKDVSFAIHLISHTFDNRKNVEKEMLVENTLPQRSTCILDLEEDTWVYLRVCSSVDANPVELSRGLTFSGWSLI